MTSVGPGRYVKNPSTPRKRPFVRKPRTVHKLARKKKRPLFDKLARIMASRNDNTGEDVHQGMYDALEALIAMLPPPPSPSKNTSDAEIMIREGLMNTPEPSLACAVESHYSPISLASDEDDITAPSNDDTATTACDEISLPPPSSATSTVGPSSSSASSSIFTSVTPLPDDGPENRNRGSQVLETTPRQRPHHSVTDGCLEKPSGRRTMAPFGQSGHSRTRSHGFAVP